MKITLNIETNDPADLERIAAALAGKEVAVTTGKPAAPKKTETAPSTTATASAQQAAPAAEPAPAASADAAVPSEADLIAAANAALGKAGNGGPAKIKAYIAANFKKADGSPGTVKETAEGDRARLLDHLQKIGRGEITL